VIFLPLQTAERCFYRPGNVNTISVVLAEGADEKATAAAIQSQLPKGLTVDSPAARSQLSKETIRNVEKGLDFADVAILALAFFMILNTFLMNVGERRRQLAVLRAIGATRRQVIRMLLLEGLMLGIVGTILGCAAGIGGAFALTRSMGQVYGAAMPAMHITMGPFVAAGILGPCVSLAAMFGPAWIAGKVSPLEGMRFIAAEGRGGVSLRYVLLAVVIFLLTGSVMAACLLGYLPIRWMIVSGVIFTAAFVLLVPALLGILAWLVATGLYPLLGHRRPNCPSADLAASRPNHANRRNPLYRRQHGGKPWARRSSTTSRHSNLGQYGLEGRLLRPRLETRSGQRPRRQDARGARQRTAGHSRRIQRRFHPLSGRLGPPAGHRG